MRSSLSFPALSAVAIIFLGGLVTAAPATAVSSAPQLSRKLAARSPTPVEATGGGGVGEGGEEIEIPRDEQWQAEADRMGKECEAKYEESLRAIIREYKRDYPGEPIGLTYISEWGLPAVDELWRCIRKIPGSTRGRWPTLKPDTDADLQGSVDEAYSVCVDDHFYQKEHHNPDHVIDVDGCAAYAGAGRGRFQPNRGAYAFENGHQHPTLHRTPGHAVPLGTQARLLASFDQERSVQLRQRQQQQQQHQHQQHNLGANLARAWSRGAGQMKSNLQHLAGFAGSAVREGKVKEALLRYAHE
ncbi:MAG: hypothetical protein M1826_005462 [Phylliscum demangeonii]|nr:MAG: hypothetical protein M1826_005462 [Phylliscum demangeonii]